MPLVFLPSTNNNVSLRKQIRSVLGRLEPHSPTAFYASILCFYTLLFQVCCNLISSDNVWASTESFSKVFYGCTLATRSLVNMEPDEFQHTPWESSISGCSLRKQWHMNPQEWPGGNLLWPFGKPFMRTMLLCISCARLPFCITNIWLIHVTIKLQAVLRDG